MHLYGRIGYRTVCCGLNDSRRSKFEGGNISGAGFWEGCRRGRMRREGTGCRWGTVILGDDYPSIDCSFSACDYYKPRGLLDA